MSAQIEISSNAAAVLAQVQNFSASLLDRLCPTIDFQNELTIAAIQRDKLSRRGPRTLGVVTDRLRSSIARAPARVAGDTVISAIGSNVVYAGIHEYGYDGIVKVRAFTRQVDDRSQRVAKVIDMRTGRISKGGKVKAKLKPEKITESVRAHDRHMVMPERRYIRSTVEQRGPDYSEAVSAKILADWRGGQG